VNAGVGLSGCGHLGFGRTLVDRAASQVGEECAKTSSLADFFDRPYLVVEIGLTGEHLPDCILFGFDVIGTHERRRIAESGMCFVLSLDQSSEDSDVA